MHTELVFRSFFVITADLNQLRCGIVVVIVYLRDHIFVVIVGCGGHRRTTTNCLWVDINRCVTFTAWTILILTADFLDLIGASSSLPSARSRTRFLLQGAMFLMFTLSSLSSPSSMWTEDFRRVLMDNYKMGLVFFSCMWVSPSTHASFFVS